MKKITIIIISLLMFNLVNAQSKNKLSRAEKNILKKAVLVEIIDISGETHKGYLWYADSTQITISNKAINADSLITIEPEYIYTLKLYKKAKYGKRYLNSFIATTVVSAAITIVSAASGDANMLGPYFVFGVLAVGYGAPLSLATAIIPYNTLRKYYINTSEEKYLRCLRYMKKNKFKKAISGNIYNLTLKPKKNVPYINTLEIKRNKAMRKIKH